MKIISTLGSRRAAAALVLTSIGGIAIAAFLATPLLHLATAVKVPPTMIYSLVLAGLLGASWLIVDATFGAAVALQKRAEDRTEVEAEQQQALLARNAQVERVKLVLRHMSGPQYSLLSRALNGGGSARQSEATYEGEELCDLGVFHRRHVGPHLFVYELDATFAPVVREFFETHHPAWLKQR